MTHFRFEAVLPTNASSYLIERNSAGFRSLQADYQSLERLEFVESWQTGDYSYLKLVSEPRAGAWIPKTAAKHLPSEDALEVVDTIEFRPELARGPPFTFSVHTDIPVLGKKAEIRSQLTIEEAGPALTRQVLEGHIKIKILGLGKIAEKLVKSSLADSYEKLPRIVAKWEESKRGMPLGQALGGLPYSLKESSWIPVETRNRCLKELDQIQSRKNVSKTSQRLNSGALIALQAAAGGVAPPAERQTSLAPTVATDYFSTNGDVCEEFEELSKDEEPYAGKLSGLGSHGGRDMTDSEAWKAYWLAQGVQVPQRTASMETYLKLEKLARFSRKLGLTDRVVAVTAAPVSEGSRPAGVRDKSSFHRQILQLFGLRKSEKM